MKLADLFEEPYEHTSGHHRDDQVEKYGQMSDDALKRDNIFLGTVDSRHGEKIRIYALKEPKYAVIRGLIDGHDELGRKTNFVVFALRFKKKVQAILPPSLDINSCFQVNSVFISPEFRNEGISSTVYRYLTSKGLVIISDNTQFTDGKELWKKLVRDTALGEYKIFILDDEYGFEKDENGDPIEYDGSNIKDSKIWTSGDDLSGYNKLLVMKA